MEDLEEIKTEDLEGAKFDAFTDGTAVHRTYRLRTPKPKNDIKEEPAIKSNKNPIYYDFDQTFNCSKCTKSFDSKTGLLNHLRMHDVVRKFTCALCQKTFVTNEELIEHKNVHKDEDRLFVCKICKVAFTDHCDFLVHDLSHTKKSTHKCPECTMYYKPGYIKLHIATHFRRNFDCDSCGKTFSSETNLRSHMRSHDPTTFKECGECGRVFKEKKYLDFHMSSHTGIKPIQCLYCGVGFLTNQQRQVHTQRVHLTDRPHECKVCDRKFKMLMDLKSHLKTHDKIKNIECDVCGKKFLHKQSLTFHKRLHTNENMFDCPECDKKCPTRQALRNHMVYIHTDSKDFKCELCDLSYKTISALRKHNNSKMHKRAEYGLKINKKNEP